jgi:hypothetical protein
VEREQQNRENTVRQIMRKIWIVSARETEGSGNGDVVVVRDKNIDVKFSEGETD